MIRDSWSLRLGGVELERRDIGSKWNASWQLNVGERYRVVEFSRLKLSMGLNLSGDDGRRLSLELFGFWIRLPWKAWREKADGEIMESWGFGYFEKSMHFRWGTRCKIVYMPWDFQHVDKEHKFLLADGKSWETVPRWRHGQPNPDDLIKPRRWIASYPYRYMVRSGDVQNVDAEVTVERRRWRRRGLPAWLPIAQKRSTCIDIRFTNEVGERAGSWKGGCTGCSYEMKPGETPRNTLARMEQERRFT